MAKFPVLGSLLSSCRSFPFWYLGNYWKTPGRVLIWFQLPGTCNFFFFRVNRNCNYDYKVLSTSCLDLVILKYLHQLFPVLLFTTFRVSGANCINNYIVVVRILTAFVLQS